MTTGRDHPRAQRRRSPARLTETQLEERLRDLEADVDPDEVLKLERSHPEPAAEPCDAVDARDISELLLDDAQRLQPERPRTAVDEEARPVGGVDDALAHRLTRRSHDAQRPLFGPHARDHFDQAHHRRGVEEVHPGKALGKGNHRCQLGDRDRGRVRGDHAVRPYHCAEAREEIALEVERLRRRLDHKVARSERGNHVDGLDASDTGGRVVGRNPSTCDRLVEARGGRVDAALRGTRQRVVEQRPRSDRAGQLGDTCTHRPGARDADDGGQTARRGLRARPR